MKQNITYSCSSWNYGSYTPYNPYYTQQNKYSNIPNQNRYVHTQNNNVYNKFGKRALPEEERIVTNEYMKEINHIKYLEKSKNSLKTRKKKKKRENNIWYI